MKTSVVPALTRVFILSALISPALAVDWPMWRYDAGRTASSPEELPPQLYLQWTRQYSERQPVWDDPLNQDLMSFDATFEPVVLGDTLFLGFNDRDKIVALDIRTGSEKWTFYTDGPVRLPLAGRLNRIYFTSDDGFLYCLSADTGTLLWRFRGGPRDRKILGNKRLVSTWPARGGVVIYGNTVYFAASIWPFMGTFIYALDAETGRVIWRNEGIGADYQKQPHNSPAFAGVAPQGALVALADRLLIPGGRSVPACLDRRTGQLLYYRLAEYNKTGGAFVCADERYFFNHYRDRDTDLYDLRSGKQVARRVGKYPVLAGRLFFTSGDSISVHPTGLPATKHSTLKVDATGDLIKAGSRLYAGGDGQVTAVQTMRNGALKPVWVQKVDGRVTRLVAANGMLIAVTKDGKLVAFGKEAVAVTNHLDKPDPPRQTAESARSAQTILEQAGVRDGYGLFYGSGASNADLLASLVTSSDLDIIAIMPGTEDVQRLRVSFDRVGLLGKRLHVLEGTPESFEPPSYMASLVVIADQSAWSNDDCLRKMVRSVRPYGGKIWISRSRLDSPEPGRRTKEESPPAIKALLSLDSTLSLYPDESSFVLSKDGPLTGGPANWTHQYGSIANTVKSDDELVKLPLGILWFGGSSNLDVLPRHGHGPPEQIVDGRLIIEGVDCISARDIYTGRVLWKTGLDPSDTLEQYYDKTYDENAPLVVKTNQQHIPGANARGTNFIATSDWVYILQGNRCHVLDIKTGETRRIISLPSRDGVEPAKWGYIGISGDKLIAGSDFAALDSIAPLVTESTPGKPTDKDAAKQRARLQIFGKFDGMASRSLVVMDRHDGSVKWRADARYGFIHNAIAASDEILFCLDKLPPAVEKRLRRRGLDVPSDYRLMALDLDTGRVIWERNINVFGSWLSYSREHDRLLQATRPSRDMVTDETGERMAVYVASSGDLVWDRKIKYNNPPILHGEQIITDNAAYSMATGERKLRVDPLTGEDVLWSYARGYGCNYNIASEHLLSFRSAAAGFYDLLSDAGTGNLGGFKSGCTSNLIAAGGVLNAPDYTRTCQCSYQNQTSLALIHMPELEYWTTNDFVWNGKPVERIGINLNAPGDRVAPDGTLWLDFPSVGGRSPDIPIRFEAAKTHTVRRHSLSLTPSGQEWVAASGLAGPLKLEVTLSQPAEKGSYTVKLHFAELEDKKPGERVFNVRLQGREVLHEFDIAQNAEGANRPVVKEFSKVQVEGMLTVECIASSAAAKAPPLLCGIEIVLEDSAAGADID